MKLEKIMGITYVTEELMEDAPFVSSLTSRQFSLAAQRLLEGGVMSGTGEDQMLGILNSPALVEVGASGASVSAEDVLGMWQRFDTRYRSNAVWVAHPDMETQLPLLTLNGESVWLPEGGLSGQGYQTILGRPVIFTDHCAEAGKKGSFNLIDFSQYMLLKKGTVKEAWSMHVAFLTDQHAFRMTFRCNGAPKVDSPIKLKNSALTRSPFVTLGARS
jgi:HK97 family phage major capsid protein